jgi:hypothetical protein
VTTMDAAAARRHDPRAALVVLMGLAGFGLMGCETSNSLFGGPSVATQEPAPAARQVAAQPPLAKVTVAPVIGAPDNIAKQIQQEFASAVERQRVSVVTSKEERPDYTLRAYVVAARDKNATKVSYIWDVTDPTGKRVNRITGEEVVAGNGSKDPWSSLTPGVAQSIASKAASSFLAWLPSQGTQTPAAPAVAGQPVGVGAQPIAAAQSEAARATPVATNKTTATVPTTGSITGRGGAVMATVPSVTGAPGDGTSSLTAAIQRELSGRGVAVTDKPVTTAYRVEGSVSVGQPKDGKQSIHIEWQVKDPQGKKVGTVSQRNEIPEGSLDGAWGQTAEQAAGAAAQGIIKLLPQAKATN